MGNFTRPPWIFVWLVVINFKLKPTAKVNWVQNGPPTSGQTFVGENILANHRDSVAQQIGRKELIKVLTIRCA